MTDAAHPILAETDGKAIPVHPVAESEVEAFLARKRAPVRTYAAANRFSGKAGQVLAVPGASGAIEQVLMGVGAGRADLSLLRGLAGKLPAGDYALSRLPKGIDGEQAARSAQWIGDQHPGNGGQGDSNERDPRDHEHA